MNRKGFHISAVLSVGTGYLMMPTGMSGVYSLLNHLVGGKCSLRTHQLRMAMDRNAPTLIAACPWLIDAKEEFKEIAKDAPLLADWNAAVERLAAIHGDTIEVMGPLIPTEGVYADPMVDY